MIKEEKDAASKAPKRKVDPSVVIDTQDPGDATLRNFRYQFLYGVILLCAAKAGHRPYRAIWCEHYEDYLCERHDGLFDGVQVKTREQEQGYWNCLDDPFVKTIGRFVDFHERLGKKLGRLYFVSNAQCQTATSDDTKRAKSPALFIQHVQSVAVHADVAPPFTKTFIALQAQCGCTATQLFDVLQKMDVIHAPSRKDIDAVVSNQHLGRLKGFETLAALKLDDARDELVGIIFRASSLQVTDPTRHYRGMIGEEELPDPALRAKRLLVDDVMIPPSGNGGMPLMFQFVGEPQLKLGLKRQESVLVQKLRRGGLEDEIEYLRVRERSAEYKLMEDAIARSELYPAMQTQIENVVLGAVSEAHIRARQNGGTFGQQMMIGVQDRLKKIADETPGQVGNHGFDCLMGVAGLFTSECRVWWSERFEIEQEVSP